MVELNEARLGAQPAKKQAGKRVARCRVAPSPYLTNRKQPDGTSKMVPTVLKPRAGRGGVGRCADATSCPSPPPHVRLSVRRACRRGLPDGAAALLDAVDVGGRAAASGVERRAAFNVRNARGCVPEVHP